jgi:hypothetical protein
MTTNPPEPQNIESRVTRNEIDIRELKLSISELRSTVSTLADLITIQQQESQADREQAAQDRIETNRRFEESRQQADQDRALMLQLIQSIAQGRNGG